MSDDRSIFRDDLPKSIFKDDPWAQAQAPASPVQPPAVGAQYVRTPLAFTAPATPVVAAETGANALPLGLLAGAGVALFGGLVWAGVVIAIHWDIGVLAWLVGAATGLAVARVAGGELGPGARITAGFLAAGGILVGKYVIFVHTVRKAVGEVGDLLGVQAPSVGYLDTRAMGVFIHHLGTFVRPIYVLWIALAFVAAIRTSGGGAIFGRRR